MYKTPPSADLFQSDVISGFSYPVFSNATSHFSQSTGRHEFSANVTVKSGHIVIVSHGCDLLVYDKGPKRPAVLFCPMIRVPEYIRSNPERYAILRQNIIDPQRPHFVNLFLYQREDPLSEDMVIDLSLIQPFPITSLDALRSKKTLELVGEQRQLLQTKLMHHFGRPE